MKDPNDKSTPELPLGDAGLAKDDGFELDDTPLVCPRDQSGDKPCESCQ